MKFPSCLSSTLAIAGLTLLISTTSAARPEHFRLVVNVEKVDDPTAMPAEIFTTSQVVLSDSEPCEKEDESHTSEFSSRRPVLFGNPDVGGKFHRQVFIILNM